MDRMDGSKVSPGSTRFANKSLYFSVFFCFVVTVQTGEQPRRVLIRKFLNFS
jgi:hypothetical protein